MIPSLSSVEWGHLYDDILGLDIDVLSLMPKLQTCLLTCYFASPYRDYKTIISSYRLDPFLAENQATIPNCEFWLFLDIEGDSTEQPSQVKRDEATGKQILFGQFPIREKIKIQ